MSLLMEPATYGIAYETHSGITAGECPRLIERMCWGLQARMTEQLAELQEYPEGTRVRFEVMIKVIPLEEKPK